MRLVRTAILSTALLAGAAALAGCGSTASTTTTTTTGASTTTTATSSTTTTSAGSTTTTSTQPATAPTCTPSELKVLNGGASGAAGSIFTTIGIENSSAAVCTLDGRPGVALVGKRVNGTTGPIPVTVKTTGSAAVFAIAPATVTLNPGATAAAGFLIQSSDVPENGETACPEVQSLRVSLPGSAAVYPVGASFTACGGPTISVSAVVASDQLPSSGSGGNSGGGTSGVANPPASEG